MLKGLIVSIQGYSLETTKELARIVINSGACAIRSDWSITGIDTIYLEKKAVDNRKKQAYITTDIGSIDRCESKYIAIDSRRCNANIKELYKRARGNGLQIVGDIRNINDCRHLADICCVPDYIATTFGVFDFSGNYRMVEEIRELMPDQKIIAEGGYNRQNIVYAFTAGACAVCVGHEITGIEAKTRNMAELIRMVNGY